MPSRDVAQLILEVDARIATAQRAVNQLARSIQQDSADMERSLGRVSNAHANIGKAFNDNNGRIRAGFTQLSFQIGDVTQQMSLGVSGARIFAQQSGQVIQALQVMGGEGNKFLQFLGGPWGIAISTAAVILAPLASKLFDTKDEVGKLVDKMREQSKEAANQEAANKIWARSIDGVTDSYKKLADEIQKGFVTPEIAAQAQQTAAQSNLDKFNRELTQKQQQLAKLQGQRKNKLSALELADTPDQQAIALDALHALDAKIAAVQGRIDKLKTAITAANRLVTDLQIQTTSAQAKSTANAGTHLDSTVSELEARLQLLSRTNQNVRDSLRGSTDALETFRQDAAKAAGFDELNGQLKTADARLRQLHDQLLNGVIGPARFASEVRKLASALDDAAKAAAAAKKGTGELTSFIMPVEGKITSGFGPRQAPLPGASSNHPAIDIAAPIGTPVKAAAGGVVIYTGKLGGLGNVVVVDHGGGTITEYGHLSKILTQKGASVGQGDVIAQVGSTGISTGPHLDYRVKVNGKYVDPRKGQFATDSAAAGVKAGNAAETAAEKAIRQQNAFTEEGLRLDQELLRAKNDLIHGVDAEADAAIASLQAEQERRKAGYDNDVKEGKISQANADILKAKIDQITLEKAKAVEIQRQLQHLQRSDELEQRGFQYQIDDMRFADEMATTQAEHRRIQLDILDVVYQQKDAHLRALKAELELAGKIEEAAAVQAQIDRLPTEKAQDRERVNRGTMSPLEAWAHDVPKTAAEINEALQSIEARGLENLSNALTEVVMGTKSLGAAFKDVARSIIADILQMTIKMLIFRALSSVLGGVGNVSGGAGGAPGGATYFATGRARASGGPVSAGQAYIVGEHQPELFVPKSDGFILPKVPKIGIPGAANDRGGPLNLTVNVHARDAVLTSQVKSWVAEGILEAAPHIVRAAHDTTVRSMTRPRLPG